VKNHRVFFYEDDSFLIKTLVQYVKKGLQRQETVIILATDRHRGELERTLMGEESVRLWPQHLGTYVTLDTSVTLALFMRNGWPDEHLFFRVMREIIESAAGATSVRIYGEMVAVLWAEGNTLAAIQLERLWNKLGDQREFSLLCGYPTHAVQDPDCKFALREVCACHSKTHHSNDLAA
jgi:MEDS: MEthanogen/methylotroph, DcmR Sensory domain